MSSSTPLRPALTPTAVRHLAARHMVVVGDALLDRFTEAHAERQCREGPAPMVRVDGVRSCPGGAANVAANAAALGASVELVAVVGDDPAGDELLAALDELGVGLSGVVRDPDWSTPLLNRVRADGELLVRVDEGEGGLDREHGAERPGSRAVAALLADRVRAASGAADALVVSDYERGTMGDAVVDAVAELAEAPARPLVAVDARRVAHYRRARPTVVKPSWAEAVPLMGREARRGPGDRAAVVTRHGRRVLAGAGAHIAAVTLDRDGAVVLERGRPPCRTFAHPTSEDHATGAGDTYLAALTLALASRLATPDAAEMAAHAAAVAVRDRFTCLCPAEALERAVAEDARVGLGAVPAPAIAGS